MAKLQTTHILISLFFPLVICEFSKETFSTKTAYKWVHDIDQNVIENEWMNVKFEGRRCTAINSQIFFRHGARYPGLKDIRNMSKLHQKLLLVVTNPKSLSFMKTWENNFPQESEKLLVDEGEDEQYLLGQRIAARLKHLFNGSVKRARFISSSKERCKDSAAAFYEGLTEIVLDEAHDDLVPEIDNKILRFHETCQEYIRAVEKNKSYNIEYKTFKTSPEMMEVAENVKQRLGIGHAEIDAGELKLINFLCSFEMIILEKNEWCQLLNDTDREVLEYHSDIKQYWRKAYGHPIMARMACPLVKTIFTALDKAARMQLNNMNRRGDVAAFYFGHVETLAPFFAALGFFKDSDPLLAANFSKMKNRSFKSSQILPFSANIAFILYNCGNSSSFDEDDLMLKIFVNEKTIKIPVCDNYQCAYRTVRDAYKHQIDDCNYKKVCSLTHDEL